MAEDVPCDRLLNLCLSADAEASKQQMPEKRSVIVLTTGISTTYLMTQLRSNRPDANVCDNATGITEASATCKQHQRLIVIACSAAY